MDWEDYTEIAEALEERYPSVSIDALSLSDKKLRKMILSLRGFEGDKKNPDIDLDVTFIRNEWVSIRMPETFCVNDSAYV